MALTITVTRYESAGSEKKVYGTIAFDSSYQTGGESFTAAQVGLTSVHDLQLDLSGGYLFRTDYANNKILAYNAGGGSFTGTTPTSSLDLTTPAFSGTGLTAAGQVITTTSTHTMTLNQCAGMWLISATGSTPPNLILSNTAVTGAAAVLTVQGAASTDAGAYKIVRNVTPAGLVNAAVLSEAPNTTNLSALTAVPFVATGY